MGGKAHSNHPRRDNSHAQSPLYQTSPLQNTFLQKSQSHGNMKTTNESSLVKSVLPHCSTPLASKHKQLASFTPTPVQSATPIPKFQPNTPPVRTDKSSSNVLPSPSITPPVVTKSRRRNSHRKSQKSNYKWKRPSTNADTSTPAQSLGKRSSKSNRYKWKRRSSSGVQPALESAQSHSKPSNVTKSSSSRYLWKRHGSSGNASNLTTPTPSRHKIHHKGVVVGRSKYKLRTK